LQVIPREGAAVDGSDTGTGKTLVAVETVKRLGNPPTLVICPKVVIPAWQRTAAAQGIDLDVLNIEKLRAGNTPYGGWYPRDSRHPTEWFGWNPGIKFLVIDEAHRCKASGNKRVNGVIQPPRNAELMRAARRQRIPALAMSATLADTPLEMDALGYLLRLHDSDSKPTLRNPHPTHFLDWARDYGVRMTSTGPEFIGGPVEMARIHAQLYPHKGVRVRIKDLGDLFPETQITAELCEIDNPEKVDAIYAEMAEALAELKKRTDRYFTDEFAMAERQKVELLKVPAFVDLAQDAIAQRMSVAIFVNFRLTLQEICRRLGTDCFIDGSQIGPQGSLQREANRLAFQSDRSRIIVCIAEAGGLGLDLHDITGRHPRLALISPGYNAKTLKQVLGRVWRAGGLSKSLQRLIFARGTIEETVHAAVSRKCNNLDALQDGDLEPRNFQLS